MKLYNFNGDMSYIVQIHILEPEFLKQCFTSTETEPHRRCCSESGFYLDDLVRESLPLFLNMLSVCLRYN